MAGNGVPPHNWFNQGNGAPPAQQNQFMPYPPYAVPYGFAPGDERTEAQNRADPRAYMDPGYGPQAPHPQAHHHYHHFGAPHMHQQNFGYQGAAQAIHPILHTELAQIQVLQGQLMEAREERRQLEKTFEESKTAHGKRIEERKRIYGQELEEASRVFQMAEEVKKEQELREEKARKRIKLEPIDDDDDGYGQGSSYQPSTGSNPALQGSGSSFVCQEHHLEDQTGPSPDSVHDFPENGQSQGSSGASEYRQISADSLIGLLTNHEALDLCFNLQASRRGSEQNLPEDGQPHGSNGQEASVDHSLSPNAWIRQLASNQEALDLHFNLQSAGRSGSEQNMQNDDQPHASNGQEASENQEANADAPEYDHPVVGEHPDGTADDGSEADNAKDDHFQPAALRDPFQEADAPESDDLSALLLGQRNDITDGQPLAEEDPEDVLQQPALRDHSPEADASELMSDAALLSGAPDDIPNGVAADDASEDLLQPAALRERSPEAAAPSALQQARRVRSRPAAVPWVPHATTVPLTKDDFKKYNAARRAFAKTMVVPAPLDPTTEEYRQLLQEAKDHRAHTLVAGDIKLPFLECLYDAGNGPIPQSVQQPPKAHQLHMIFEMFDDDPPTRAQITARWKQMEAAENEEYFEWIVRAANLHDEHLVQMSKGYVCVKPKAKRARVDKE